MYMAGEEEIEAIAKVIRSGKLFRYRDDSECERFEKRYAKHLGVGEFALGVSGTYGLAAGLVGLGIGPGDEVLVPAHTYMATATAVLAVGAIPVIVDIDETITISPDAIRDAVGPHTRAVIPVHMWGAACDMDAIMDIAEEHGLMVLEDVCQGIGGSYEGRKLGSIGHAGAFSFNFFKNMSGGEGGGIATSDPKVAERARCYIDPCHFYWQGRNDDTKPFAGVGARASELLGAMLNVQLDRLDGMIRSMRAEKKKILAGTKHLGNLGLRATPMNSADHDCATQVMYTLPSEEAAQVFVKTMPAVIAGKTGRHTFTQWDQVLMHEGAHHPAVNPYALPQNKGLRMSYPDGMCKASLDILNRTVMVATNPLHGDEVIEDTIHNIDAAARVALEDAALDEVQLRTAAPVDLQKFDSAG
ncbi:aminotransferase class I/II-fold pyridoxal phosphate-dependent enzyme [Mesorhizobium sp. LHD-90]|uniref:DegT/DnrJ/EryC1/StrS family aminotransferase n=1 Tax=Mesorhizobium sp. LHD-90 TaxID=3071414 RepID=UPI0027DFA22C|nr:aminotransferase class I/II-fold pyridoxal phosphate-dependent enzyme [Mesorhizobium sp. LHD-90]MDQ6435523.1 aminotransferase class I/II-fold pyridoxal phosphate-dependent enzyme [Mesorhizobium sp. LHD-90]